MDMKATVFSVLIKACAVERSVIQTPSAKMITASAPLDTWATESISAPRAAEDRYVRSMLRVRTMLANVKTDTSVMESTANLMEVNLCVPIQLVPRLRMFYELTPAHDTVERVLTMECKATVAAIAATDLYR